MDQAEEPARCSEEQKGLRVLDDIRWYMVWRLDDSDSPHRDARWRTAVERIRTRRAGLCVWREFIPLIAFHPGSDGGAESAASDEFACM
jgi:hypothetical protein